MVTTLEVMPQRRPARRRSSSTQSNCSWVENGGNTVGTSTIHSDNNNIEVTINDPTLPPNGQPNRIPRSNSLGKMNTLMRRIRPKHKERNDVAPILLRKVQSHNSISNFAEATVVVSPPQHKRRQSCSPTCSGLTASPLSASTAASDEDYSVDFSDPVENTMAPPIYTDNDGVGSFLLNLVSSGWKNERSSSEEEGHITTPLNSSLVDTDRKNTIESSTSLLEKYSFSIPLSLSKSFTSMYDFWDAEEENQTGVEQSFFCKDDFRVSTWSDVVTSDSERSLSTVGFAAIMAATVVIHPMVFMTGAATAVWAVGLFHATEKGYDFFSDGSFSNLFWSDPMQELPLNIENEEEVIAAQERRVKIAKEYAKEYDKINKLKSSEDKENFEVKSERPPLVQRHEKIKESPCRNLLQQTPPRFKKYVRALDEVIQEHFPTLEHQVAKDVEFRGINALEFFEVFFSDHAPYNMKDFQENRGDIEIEYGDWKRRCPEDPISFHPNAKNQEDLVPFPTSSRKERIQTFKTLTNSFFGPAYASATKTQRVTKLSSRLVIMESKTELSSIPYCDRFFVLERWIIESVKDNENCSDSVPILIRTKLSVSVEVVMLRSCSFESQIRSKSLSTVEDIVSSWSEKARRALQLTLKQKLERMRQTNADDKSVMSYRSHSIGSKQTMHGKNSEEYLMKTHQKNLKTLEQKGVPGDLQWACIETKHSPEAGEGSAFAEVLNPNGGPFLVKPFQRIQISDRPREISFPLPPRQKQKRSVLRFMKKNKN